MAGLAWSSGSRSWPAAAAAGSAVTSPATGSGPQPEVLVTMGGIETSNLDVRVDPRDSWTQLVFSRAMPADTVSYNLAAANITAERVIETQLPELAGLHPDVVTIWVEGADVRLATPPAEYQAELAALVGAARQAGARRVLLLTPPADQTTCRAGWSLPWPPPPRPPAPPWWCCPTPPTGTPRPASAPSPLP